MTSLRAEMALRHRVEKAAQARIDAEEEQRRAAREAAFLQQLRGLVELSPPYRAGLVPEITYTPYIYGSALHLSKVFSKPFPSRRADSAFPCKNLMEMWHGTPVCNLISIAHTGLHPGRGGLFGSGIYLTRDINKALNHSHGATRGGTFYSLLRCRVATGNHLVVERSGNFSHLVGPHKGYNSVYCPGQSRISGSWGGVIMGEEWVVYDFSQVEVLDVFIWSTKSTAAVDLQPAPPVPVKSQINTAKQRAGRRVRTLQRVADKERYKHREAIAQKHPCVRGAEVCRFASLSLGPHCTRHSRGVTKHSFNTSEPYGCLCSNYTSW